MKYMKMGMGFSKVFIGNLSLIDVFSDFEKANVELSTIQKHDI